MAGSPKDVESGDFCLSCEAKMAIIFLSPSSPSSPFSEEDIWCPDPKCLNFCDASNGARTQSSLHELPEAQLVMLARLHLRGGKEMEKLKRILEIPIPRMTEDQRCYANKEIGKLIEKASEYQEEEENQKTPSSSHNGH